MSILKKLRNAIFGKPVKTTSTTQRLSPEQLALQQRFLYGGGGLPSLAEGADVLRGSFGFNQDDFNKYMSPYLTGVLGDLETRGVRTMVEDILPSIQDRFIVAGQPGSSRHQEFTSRAMRDTMDMILSNQAQVGLGAHNAAMDFYLRGQGQQGAAGIGLGEMATRNMPQPWVTTNQQPGASPLSQLAGAGLGAYGMYRMFM